MRIVLALLPLAAALAGCAIVPPGAWSFDPTHPEPRPVLQTAEAVQLTERVARLNIERNAIRARIAAERDAAARLALYGDLHRVGMELSPLERHLALYALAR